MFTSARIPLLFPIVLLSLMGTAALIPGWAEEPITIQQVLEDPQVYHLRHVILRGIARDVQPLPPYAIPNGDNCYGAYLFRLENDEATIPVAVLGICGRPIVRDPEVGDGDHIEVSATIQAPSHGEPYLSFNGPNIVTERESVVQAIADRILPIAD